MTLDRLLQAIPSTEPASFNELCRALGDDCPERGDREGWRDLFSLLEIAQESGYVDIDYVGGKVGSVQLTEAGAARVRSARR